MTQIAKRVVCAVAATTVDCVALISPETERCAAHQDALVEPTLLPASCELRLIASHMLAVSMYVSYTRM